MGNFERCGGFEPPQRYLPNTTARSADDKPYKPKPTVELQLIYLILKYLRVRLGIFFLHGNDFFYEMDKGLLLLICCYWTRFDNF
jgi:hypothetical protein